MCSLRHTPAPPPRAQASLKAGDYLWELVHPQEREALPCRSPSGRYAVRLFLVDAWRAVVVDDSVPVDLFGVGGGSGAGACLLVPSRARRQR
jgi:hypothetical protein